jgi:hypothetical protein
MKYKDSLIEKVLFRDIQSDNKNANRFIAKSCNDKNGKKQNTKRVDTKRQ